MDILNQVGKKLEPPKTAKSARGSVKSGRGAESAGNSSGEDRVELSQEAKIVGRAGTAVQLASEVRTTRINALKALVRGQEYPIDARKVAEKIVEEHLFELV